MRLLLLLELQIKTLICLLNEKPTVKQYLVMGVGGFMTLSIQTMSPSIMEEQQEI